MIFRKTHFVKISAMLSIFLLMSACSNSNQNTVSTTDSFEKLNRKIFTFNKGLDTVLLKPTAKSYKAIIPKFVDETIGNFFSNLDDVGNVINNTLQGKFSDAANDAERFVFNSTFGFAGLVDVATAAGLEKHDEDFGQTLAKWGVKSGPYVMLPFLGPSTIRDASAKISIDRYTNPAHYSDENIALFIIETIKKRSDLFAQEEVLAGLSNDQYIVLRDVWLQNRKFRILDGKADPNAGSDLIDQLERLDSL